MVDHKVHKDLLVLIALRKDQLVMMVTTVAQDHKVSKEPLGLLTRLKLMILTHLPYKQLICLLQWFKVDQVQDRCMVPRDLTLTIVTCLLLVTKLTSFIQHQPIWLQLRISTLLAVPL